MPELNFQVQSAEPERFSASPLLLFRLQISHAGDIQPVHAIALRVQIRLEPARRRYTADQKDSLLELFGQPGDWSRTLRPMLWTHASVMVPSFAGNTTVDLPVPCSYDFNLAATKYFDALGDDGNVPLCLLFSGTVFYESASGNLQAAPISWDKEAEFNLPVRAWRDMMQHYYPNCAWLALNKDTFDRLSTFKTESGHVTWEHALEDLLQRAEEKVTR